MQKKEHMQTLQVVAKGYSKKLRHLPRTQRICLGVLKELVDDPDMRISMEHCPTAQMKADLFTKSLNTEKYIEAKKMIRLEMPTESTSDENAELKNSGADLGKKIPQHNVATDGLANAGG